MTEADARAAVERISGAGSIRTLERFQALLIAENDRQNLIAQSTIPTIWQRHFLDSAQLVQWAGEGTGRWIDIGTGGGFPGLVIAIVRPAPIILVEPRRRRAAFLSSVIDELGLANAIVATDRIESMPALEAAIISARAVAPIEKLLGDAEAHARVDTTWLLPRGAGWREDVETLKKHWQGTFHVEQSLSDLAAKVVVATKVSRR